MEQRCISNTSQRSVDGPREPYGYAYGVTHYGNPLYIFIILIGNHLAARAQRESEPFKLSDTLTSCSNRLSKIIANFCNNMYKIVKRDTSFIIDKLIPEELHEHMKRARLKRWRRVRRQVASECCERPCTVGNILLYCPDDAKVLKENPDIFY